MERNVAYEMNDNWAYCYASNFLSPVKRKTRGYRSRNPLLVQTAQDVDMNSQQNGEHTTCRRRQSVCQLTCQTKQPDDKKTFQLDICKKKTED